MGETKPALSKKKRRIKRRGPMTTKNITLILNGRRKTAGEKRIKTSQKPREVFSFIGVQGVSRHEGARMGAEKRKEVLTITIDRKRKRGEDAEMYVGER